NTAPVGVWCEYAITNDGFLLPIPGKTETFGVAEIAMEYENNETDLEGTPDMTNKEMEVVEDLSVINVEHESSKSHLESTGYGDITKLLRTTNNTDSSMSVCERRVSRISKKRPKAKKRRQLYLEKGHTMMECDSVHATLEKYFIPPINAPSDYIAQMRNVVPFKIHSLRSGKKAGEPVVTDIRALEYRNNWEILFKLRHTGAFQFLPQG
ncbi:hypothetical protein ILUMI_17348, partial [Ignelater luminosus]